MQSKFRDLIQQAAAFLLSQIKQNPAFMDANTPQVKPSQNEDEHAGRRGANPESELNSDGVHEDPKLIPQVNTLISPFTPKLPQDGGEVHG